MQLITETIVAQATPAGRGGISVVRVSGPLVMRIMIAIFKKELIPRQAFYLPFYDEKDEMIDEGLGLFFNGPHSFTGEDVLELQGHGSPIVVDLLIERIIQLGARLARPGEFSERAYLNNKMDLTQAEAIADLIDAASKEAAKLAIRSLQGEFSKAIHALVENLIKLRIYIEASLDFSEEEIDFLSDAHIKNVLYSLIEKLEIIRGKGELGNLLKEGIKVIIVGKPNVGKSSLLNALTGKETAIVTDIPGTTRDLLRDYFLLEGIPIQLIDTAGLRETVDKIEQEGINRACCEMEQSDLILWMTDKNDESFRQEMETFLEKFSIDFKKTPFICIRNKIDLTQESPVFYQRDEAYLVALSAETGEGLELLKAAIQSKIKSKGNTENIFLARRRHLDALNKAHDYFKEAKNQLKRGQGELAAEELRLAQQALGEITGQFSADDLLGRIFSEFCIGK